MHFKASSLLVAAWFLTAATHGVNAAEGDVFTATRVYQEIVSESPFIIDQTTVVTWTQSASITESTTASPIPDTVETGTTQAL